MTKFLFLLPAAFAFPQDLEWESWKLDNKVKFTPTEEKRRFEIFNENREFVKQHNSRFEKGLETYTVELNKFAALTNAEWRGKYLSPVVDLALEYPCPVHFTSDGSSAPDQLSWRVMNATSPGADSHGQSNAADVQVTMVKDQGQCGSCWTFGSSAAMEAELCRKNRFDCSSWEGLATQQLVDCASDTTDSTDPNVIDLSPYDSHGCNGGFQSNAMRYAILNGGQMNWTDYAYTSGTTEVGGTCQYDKSKANLHTIDNCGATAPGNEDELKAAVNEIGAMTVSIDASHLSFQLYSSGVYNPDNCSSTRLDHAVTLTGYGIWSQDDSEVEYWEIKNSWNTVWGMGGYVNIARNNRNKCGVATDARYSILN